VEVGYQRDEKKERMRQRNERERVTGKRSDRGKEKENKKSTSFLAQNMTGCI
jgi:hypothetical protein